MCNIKISQHIGIFSESPQANEKRKRFDYERDSNAQQQLEKAITAVVQGKISQRQAARQYGVPQTTISMKMKQRGLIQPAYFDLHPL